MQTAKNVFLWPGRNWLRKAFEVWFTVLIKLASAVAEHRNKIIHNGVALGPRSEREWGHWRQQAAGSTRRTHPCAPTLSAMRASRCAPRRRPQSVERDCRRFEGRTARGGAQRQAVIGIVECSAWCREAAKGRRPRRTDRSAVVGDRMLARPGTATRPEAPLQAGCGDCKCCVSPRVQRSTRWRA